MGLGAIALVGAISALSAGTAVMSQRSQNKAAKAQQEATQREYARQTRQANLQAGNELQKEMRQFRGNMGRITVAQQNSGISLAGLEQSTSVGTAENLRNINLNAVGNLEGLRNQAQQQLIGLESQKGSVFMSGLSGAISGATAGLQLAGGIKSLSKPKGK